MTIKLEPYERSYIAGSCKYLPPDRTVTGYRYSGLPTGQQAYVVNLGGQGAACWRIGRESNGVWYDWTGDYASAAEAQAALTATIQQEADDREDKFRRGHLAGLR